MRVKKYSQAKISQQNKNELTLNNKDNIFYVRKTFKSVKVVCFAFWCFFALKPILQKKKKKKEKLAWNCPSNLNLPYYWSVLYFTGIFILNGKQLLNKSDIPKFYPKMFVYSQDDKSFYKNLTEYGDTFTKMFMITIQGCHESENNTSRIFGIEFRGWLRSHFYHKVTDWWQHEPGRWKQEFLDGVKFSRK